MSISFPETLPELTLGAPEKPEIVFLHANSYCPSMYLSLLNPLSTDFHVRAPALPGHGGSDWTGVVNSWYDLADHYLRIIPDTHRPQILMGHSIGGILAMIMTLQVPTRFSRIVLLDPVLLPKRILALIRVLRFLKLDHHLPLVQKARHRKTRFADREEALVHYRRKPIFRHWETEAFEHYVDGCLVDDGAGGKRLACRPELEESIYLSIPLDTWRLPGRLPIPGMVITGEYSDTVSPRGVQRLRRINGNLIVKTLPGGHLFPFEKPALASDLIMEFLK